MLSALDGSEEFRDVLDASQAHELVSWYSSIGSRRISEDFGSLVLRIAKHQLGKPYYDAPPDASAETLQCRLDSFQCVSLVETSLALGRCIWLGDATQRCFLLELRRLRYRGGVLRGYASRLHYYEEWLTDNAARGNLTLLTKTLGGQSVTQPFFFMTSHPEHFTALSDPLVYAAIAQTEARLSLLPIPLLERQQIRDIEAALHNGDVVAVTGSKPGILVSHTGFVSREHGVAHLLHASSYRGHVMLSEHDLAQYILRSNDRRGILVARPVPPR